MSCIIYNDLECLIEKMDGCANNPEKYSTTKLGEHIPCGYSMPTIWAFDIIENKQSLYCWEDCWKSFIVP